MFALKIPPKVFGYPISKWGMLNIGEFYHLEFELLYCDWKSTSLHFRNLINNNLFFLKQNTKWVNFLDLVFPSRWIREWVQRNVKKIANDIYFFLLHPWHLLIVTWSICIFLLNKKSLHLFLVLVFQLD